MPGSIRNIFLLDAGVQRVPRGVTARGRLQKADVEVLRADTTPQLKDKVNDAFTAKGTPLRSGEWEFMRCVNSVMVPIPGDVDGRTFLNKYKRSDLAVYIRRRQSLAPVLNAPREHASIADAEESTSRQNDAVIMIEDEPAAPALQLDDQPVEVEESIFEQAIEDPGSVMKRKCEDMGEMLEGWTGPHVTAIRCIGAGDRRPWPLPLSPMAAEDISGRQDRPLVAVIGLTAHAEQTSVAEYTSAERFFRLFEPVTGRKQAMFINVNPDTAQGMDYMREHGIQRKSLPALVVSRRNKAPLVWQTSENGSMDRSVGEVHTEIQDFCSVFTLDDE